MEKASSSVLKLASTIQRIGKKIRKPKNQAPIVDTTTCCVVAIRAMSLCLQVAADDTDEEEGDDVRDHDGNEAARGCAADIVLDQRLRIDQEGDVGGRQPRATARGHVDLCKDREQEDGLDQDHHRDRTREM